MGGLALKHLNVRRIDATEYQALSKEMCQVFAQSFGAHCQVVPSYRFKPDFGDCDLIMSSEELPENWRQLLEDRLPSLGWIKNGDVTSMEFKGVQFDFISVPKAHVEMAYTYFAYNDLGNLMGRIAHKMGFKYGQEGLSYVVRNDHHAIGEFGYEGDIRNVFQFLDLDYDRWLQGFDQLEDIFKFVASSRFFHPDIYLLHNVNAVSRIRDAKRKTYMSFLKWCAETEFDRPLYQWSMEPEDRILEKTSHLQRAYEFWPELEGQVNAAWKKEYERRELASRWNGVLVTEWTGLSGKELGQFMAHVRNYEGFAEASKDVAVMEAFTKDKLESFRSQLPPVAQ